MKNISYLEYRRRVFNKALLECFGRIHEACTGFDCCKEEEKDYVAMGRRMSDVFYKNLLNLDDCAISTTKQNLNGACTFIKDCVDVCESVAEDKCCQARDAKLEIPEDQEIELGEEDKAVVDKLFTEKEPELQVDQVRDATVNALLAEDRRAEEVRNSLDIAQAQATSEGKPEVMEETVKRLNSRAPTSLMNAILNAVSGVAVRDVNEAAEKPVPIGTIMKNNADEIKNRAILMYTLYECASVFGIHKYTPSELKAEAQKIYYGK